MFCLSERMANISCKCDEPSSFGKMDGTFIWWFFSYSKQDFLFKKVLYCYHYSNMGCGSVEGWMKIRNPTSAIPFSLILNSLNEVYFKGAFTRTFNVLIFSYFNYKRTDGETVIAWIFLINNIHAFASCHRHHDSLKI